MYVGTRPWLYTEFQITPCPEGRAGKNSGNIVVLSHLKKRSCEKRDGTSVGEAYGLAVGGVVPTTRDVRCASKKRIAVGAARMTTNSGSAKAFRAYERLRKAFCVKCGLRGHDHIPPEPCDSWTAKRNHSQQAMERPCAMHAGKWD